MVETDERKTAELVAPISAMSMVFLKCVSGRDYD